MDQETKKLRNLGDPLWQSRTGYLCLSVRPREAAGTIGAEVRHASWQSKFCSLALGMQKLSVEAEATSSMIMMDPNEQKAPEFLLQVQCLEEVKAARQKTY